MKEVRMNVRMNVSKNKLAEAVCSMMYERMWPSAIVYAAVKVFLLKAAAMQRISEKFRVSSYLF